MYIKKIKRDEHSSDFLAKDTTDFFRGLAILVILFGHIIQFGLPNYNGALKILYHLGSAGSAAFLFLSGYASAVSSLKTERLGLGWLVKRIVRLYLTFLPVYAVSAVCVLIQKPDGVSLTLGKLITQMSLMTLPLFLNWYLKVQAVLYIVFFALSMLPRKKLRGLITAVLCAVYIFVCIHFGIQNFWFLSVLAFPLGVLTGDFRDKIVVFLSRLSFGRIAVFFSVCFIWWLSYQESLGVRRTAVYTNLILAAAILLFSFDFKLKIEPVNFFGRYSLEIYLWHLCLIGIAYLSPFPTVSNKLKILGVLLLSPLLGFATNKAVGWAMKKLKRKS